jgi:PAS domain S-box-containing protein
MAKAHPAGPQPATQLAVQVSALEDLVNQLAAELAEARRALAAATQKLGATGRTLESRTRELSEARSALSLLLATMDSTSDGILAMGHLGRALHYNTRFVEMWRIPSDKLDGLNDDALLAMQLSQVRDPVGFLAQVQEREARPDAEQISRFETTDGRVFECHATPQRVRGKRVGSVRCFRDVTATANANDSGYHLPMNPSHTSLQPVSSMPAYTSR